MGRTPEVATAQLRLGSVSRRRTAPGSGPMGTVSASSTGTNRLDLRFGIQVRGRQPDGFERAASVADTEKRLGPEPAGARPPTPLLLDVGGGVHQDAIQIEENRGALEAFHVSQ